MNLSNCPTGRDVRIESVHLEDSLALRLREMGLAPGVTVRVTQRGGFGGRVVAVDRRRFALDGVTAGRLMVGPAA